MMPLAMKAGFKLENVKELPSVLLRLPSPVPNQIYARQPVEFIGRGSFDQIMQFVQETETTHPLTILSGLVIITQPQSSESHKAVITFEWPAKHEWSR
jgi:Tfp pilus assembly protein PilO